VTTDVARAPYWPLPDAAGRTLSFTAPFGKSVVIKDCAGIRGPLVGKAVLTRLEGTAPRYVLPPLEAATIDSYLTDDCASAAPYPVSPLMTATGYLLIGVANPASSVTFYLDLASPFSGVLHGGLQETCADCGFDQGACQPIAPGATSTVQGPLHGRVRLNRSSMNPTPDVLSAYIDIREP
jgi:hypothetical protein